MFTISAYPAQVIVTFFVPVAVALVTKATLNARWKAVITMILTAVVQLVTSNQATPDGASVISAETVSSWLLALGIAVASYVGVWRPVIDVNARLAPTVGLGSSQ